VIKLQEPTSKLQRKSKFQTQEPLVDATYIEAHVVCLFSRFAVLFTRFPLIFEIVFTAETPSRRGVDLGCMPCFTLHFSSAPPEREAKLTR
jgi:hypothetical protein